MMIIGGQETDDPIAIIWPDGPPSPATVIEFRRQHPGTWQRACSGELEPWIEISRSYGTWPAIICMLPTADDGSRVAAAT